MKHLLVLAVILALACGWTASTIAAPTSPEGAMANGRSDRCIKGISKADHTNQMAAMLRKAAKKGAKLTDAGKSYLKGRHTELTPDADGDLVGTNVLAYDVGDALQDEVEGDDGPARSTQAAGRATGYAQFNYWCGYGVAVWAAFIALPATTTAIDGVWVDYWWNSGTKYLGVSECPPFVRDCLVEAGWKPRDVRLAEIIDADSSGPIAKLAKDCIYF